VVIHDHPRYNERVCAGCLADSILARRNGKENRLSIHYREQDERTPEEKHEKALRYELWEMSVQDTLWTLFETWHINLSEFSEAFQRRIKRLWGKGIHPERAGQILTRYFRATQARTL
jgi:hypothetical protein